MKRIFLNALLLAASMSGLGNNIECLDSAFANPPRDAKPIMIWQWMDGVVSPEGIKADLKAYSEAGIGGVQQFLVGGEMQTLIKNTDNAIGTDNWRQLMKLAIDECASYGLSFGTHNCPGWSSSAFPSVSPEDSMQKLVWSDTLINGKNKKISLRQPETDPELNFYRDIAVVAVADTAGYDLAKAVVLIGKIDKNGKLDWKVPKGEWRIFRFGHTSNGRTNYATAPYGGLGLECDKMSRDALDKYWSGYPTMLLDIAGQNAGKTFTRFEIDSYEAGGQDWTPLLADEFKERKGYDLLAWLPVIAGQKTNSADLDKKFNSDWQDCIRSLFAENYYGYMSELIHKVHGMKLLAQPYGTGASKPFNPIHTAKIVDALADDDVVCAEFWVKPNWGWKDIPRVTDAAHATNRQIIFAEGFTCWPLHAWKDDPASLKAIADRAFCMGINSLMLHAGAQNPWIGQLPGMTFGQWGTQWTPGQTWWQSGGAKELFAYMARCQALLQRGEYVDDFKNGNFLASDFKDLQWIHRKDGNADIYFISNPLDSAFSAMIDIKSIGRIPELWRADTGSKIQAPEWLFSNGNTKIKLNLAENDAMFIVLRDNADSPAPGFMPGKEIAITSIPVDGKWNLKFPEGWGAPENVELDSLVAWNDHTEPGVRYFSGTARYCKDINIENVMPGAKYVLRLGNVKNLARVYVNGKEAAHLWKKPFEAEITSLLREGSNLIEIDVTNLWVNRMIGDEQYPEDIEWEEPFSYDFAPGKPVVGSFMKKIPEWLEKGTPRPVSERKTVVSFKYFTKDSPLEPSGLLGPVEIIRTF